MKTRCAWAASGPLEIAYHDTEWGVPAHDDRRLFEFLILEGAQAGLSWSTILRKREAYRAAFAGFDPARIARFDARRKRMLLANEGIVRNRLKVESAVRNAQAFLEVQKECGSFDAYLWRFVNGQPLDNAWKRSAQVPASTTLSDALSKDLKKRGFNFVGTTICYAFLQAIGVVNDHTVDCFRWAEVRRKARPNGDAEKPARKAKPKSETTTTTRPMSEFERNHIPDAAAPRRWTLARAADLLPLPGTHPRSAAVYEHGSLLLKLFAPRATDPQPPHARDELYVVARGRGMFVNGDRRYAFGPGDVLFVPAGVAHRFEEFSDDLMLWVVFYGPEGGEKTASSGTKP